MAAAGSSSHSVVAYVDPSCLATPYLTDVLRELPTRVDARVEVVCGGGAVSAEARRQAADLGAEPADATVLGMAVTGTLVRDGVGQTEGLTFLGAEEMTRRRPEDDFGPATLAAHFAAASGRLMILAAGPAPKSLSRVNLLGVTGGPSAEARFEDIAAALAVDWLNLRTADPVTVRLAH